MKNYLLVLLATFLMSCSHNAHKHEESLPNESNVQVTKSLKGNRWGNIYFSAQPSKVSLLSLKDDGFSTVINLREKTEKDYNESWEKKLVKDSGLNYYNVPFSMKNDMNDEYIALVTSTVMKHRKDGKILIHCSSGNRVAIWLGAHFKKDHNFSNEKSLQLAKQLGLTKEKAESKLNKYLNSSNK